MNFSKLKALISQKIGVPTPSQYQDQYYQVLLELSQKISFVFQIAENHVQEDYVTQTSFNFNGTSRIMNIHFAESKMKTLKNSTPQEHFENKIIYEFVLKKAIDDYINSNWSCRVSSNAMVDASLISLIQFIKRNIPQANSMTIQLHIPNDSELLVVDDSVMATSLRVLQELVEQKIVILQNSFNYQMDHQAYDHIQK